MRTLRKAFTMIELIMVIVIFGIISMIGADIFVKIYDNYILARTMNTLQTKTELALEQVAKRLQYRIKDSTIARLGPSSTKYVFLADANSSYEVLEWIGAADAAQKGMWDGTVNAPGWSGFIDLDSPNTGRGSISSPGSRFDFADTIIRNLSDNQVKLDGTADWPAVVMDGHVGDYNVSSYGWYPYADSDYALKVKMASNTRLDFNDTASEKEIYEHYKLAWSAYALVPQCPAGITDDCNLTLFYNYRPWEKERLDQNASSSILAEHITTFRFIQMGDSIRLKLCIGENIYDNNISYCKEKVVF